MGIQITVEQLIKSYEIMLEATEGWGEDRIKGDLPPVRQQIRELLNKKEMHGLNFLIALTLMSSLDEGRTLELTADSHNIVGKQQIRYKLEAAKGIEVAEALFLGYKTDKDKEWGQPKEIEGEIGEDVAEGAIVKVEEGSEVSKRNKIAKYMKEKRKPITELANKILSHIFTMCVQDYTKEEQNRYFGSGYTHKDDENTKGGGKDNGDE